MAFDHDYKLIDATLNTIGLKLMDDTDRKNELDILNSKVKNLIFY